MGSFGHRAFSSLVVRDSWFAPPLARSLVPTLHPSLFTLHFLSPRESGDARCITQRPIRQTWPHPAQRLRPIGIALRWVRLATGLLAHRRHSFWERNCSIYITLRLISKTIHSKRSSVPEMRQGAHGRRMRQSEVRKSGVKKSRGEGSEGSGNPNSDCGLRNSGFGPQRAVSVPDVGFRVQDLVCAPPRRAFKQCPSGTFRACTAQEQWDTALSVKKSKKSPKNIVRLRAVVV